MGSGTARPDISVRVQDDANNKRGDDNVGRRYPKGENASLQVSGVLGHRQICTTLDEIVRTARAQQYAGVTDPLLSFSFRAN